MPSLLRKRVRSGFTVLPNKTLRDPELSFRAVGVLAHIMSLKDGTPISAEALSKGHPGHEGREAVATALRELTKAGYYRTTRRQADRGRWVTEVEVASEPELLVTEDGFPGLGAEDGFPGLGAEDGFPGAGEALIPSAPTPSNPTSGNPPSRSERTKTEVPTPAPAAPSRARDEVWDALLEVCGLAGVSPTGPERGAWNRAAKDLREVGATPDEIRTRAAAYRRAFEGARLTPSALARHWAECVATGPSTSTRPGRGDTTGHQPAPVADPIRQARGLAVTVARTDCTEAEAMAQAPSNLAARAAFREAFHGERSRLQARSSA